MSVKKYDPRNRWQRFADRKWSFYICVTISVLSLASAIATLTLLGLGHFTGGAAGTAGTAGDSQNQDGDKTGDETELVTGSSSQGLWQLPSTAPSLSAGPSFPPPTMSPTRQPSRTASSSPSTRPSQHPSIYPTPPLPSTLPSPTPSDQPSIPPSFLPSHLPSFTPSNIPSQRPSLSPSQSFPPTKLPSTPPSTSNLPSLGPTRLQTTQPSDIFATYQPGNLTVLDQNLLLSTGLKARILARTGQVVTYGNGKSSTETFHGRPDFGATFPTSDGGWIYLSNSELQERGAGGVGALRFDVNGRVIEYKRILTGTTMNCGGGKTPWNTWISCEEIIPGGQMYQVSPEGLREAAPIAMGRGGARWESFAYDIRDQEHPMFFATEDHPRGALRRFTAVDPDWNDPWTMLHGEGNLDYLVLIPNANLNGGTFRWTQDIDAGKQSAFDFYTETEGIDIYEGKLYVVSKRWKSLFILDLDHLTYNNMTTRHGVFDGAPDQISRLLQDEESQILYFTEEGGRDPGVHGRNSEGLFFTIFESPTFNDETTGLSFSPSGHHMYVAYQDRGILFEITRTDGLPFNGRTLDVKYHNAGSSMGR